MESVVLVLGGNIGDVEQRLDSAIDMIGAIDGVANLRCSKRYRTEPWGFYRAEDVAPFVNVAVIVDVEIRDAERRPFELLDAIQRVEKELGREREEEQRERESREERYASRTIDIDIILWGDRILESERLVIPHPLMHERSFVLEPLAELEERGEMQHPILKRSCRELLNDLLQ